GHCRFLPMVSKPLSIRIDDQICQVLDVTSFERCMHPNFIKWIKSDGVLCTCRFESQYSIVALSSAPAGRQLIDLAFEVGDDRAMRPGKHGRNNKSDTFAAARRSVTQDMLWAVVTQRIDFVPILPFAHIHALLIDEPSLFDVAELC